MSTTTTRPSMKPPRPSFAKTSSTTPHGLPTRAPPSVGQALPPHLTPSARSPKASQDPRTPSPNYFGFVVETSNPPDSNPGDHARRNWDFPTSQARTATATPRGVPVDANPEFEAFRRQSESNNMFNLSHGSLSSFSAKSRSEGLTVQSPTSVSKRPMESPVSPSLRRTSPPPPKKGDTMDVDNEAPKSFFDLPSVPSPPAMSLGLTLPDIHRHSIPHNTPSSSTSSPDDQLKLFKRPPRADTLPPSGVGLPSMCSSSDIAGFIKSQKVLILDLRVYPQFSASRIRGALNLCIPTTLLKRPSFTIQKLLDTFTTEAEKSQFSTWRQAQHIIVYDASSSSLKEAVPPVHVLKKFINEGWSGHADIIKGGFFEFSRKHPELVDKAKSPAPKGVGKAMLSLSSSSGPEVAPVAGGCPMPAAENAANPFFGNIRQNMDLIGGVGQMTVHYPDNITAHAEKALPQWLRSAAETSNEGKQVSDKFLHIEQTEQKRMQEALSGHVSYGTPGPQVQQKVQIAGIEKGSKNRYNNIFPFAHSRVKLQGVPDGECDYVNANHVKTSFSNKHYVATQAPIPATFGDFWRVVWEQDVRVIVMLTAESEGGQVKSHPYWNSGEYGEIRLKCLSEKKIELEDSPKPTPAAPQNPALKRPMLGQRRSTNPHTEAEKSQAKEETTSPSTDTPFIYVRHLTVTNSSHPFQPMREITQIQYTSWPDFGAPASPKHLLNLIKYADKYVRKSMTSGQVLSPTQPMPEDERPVIVHCSAGCGRTGTFCTVDSVIDMMKRQRLTQDRDTDQQMKEETPTMDIDNSDDWTHRDDIDLVQKCVEELRGQRLSMVQSLRQFVLCYESILQWVVTEDEKSGGAAQDLKLQDRKTGHTPRRSYGG